MTQILLKVFPCEVDSACAELLWRYGGDLHAALKCDKGLFDSSDFGCKKELKKLFVSIAAGNCE